MDHPFQLHGFFFEVLAIDGKKPAFRSLEDVVNLGRNPPSSSRGIPTIGQAPGCITATSSSITRPA